jgi:predicted metal-dependent peptidase
MTVITLPNQAPVKPDPHQKKRIEIASARLVIREPFFASILLGLDTKESPRFPTFATDGKRLWYNPTFAATLSDDELIGVLCHEVLHCAHLHPWRRGSREKEPWNWAIDYIANEILTKNGFKLPKDCLLDARFDGMSEEKVYAELMKNPPQGGGKGQGQGHGWNIGESLDAPGDEAERSESEARMKVEILRAAKVAKMHGKLPAGMESLLDELVNPKTPWQEVLRNFLTAVARNDYSWRRPNRRYAHTGVILPSLHSYSLGTVAVAVDTSGSCVEEFNKFLSETQGILDICRPEKVVFMQCDAAIHEVKELEQGDRMEAKVKGFGGTDFRPCFDLLDQRGDQIACLIYLTDTYGTFPDAPPQYPVLWGVTTDGDVPFGQTVRLN